MATNSKTWATLRFFLNATEVWRHEAKGHFSFPPLTTTKSGKAVLNKLKLTNSYEWGEEAPRKGEGWIHAGVSTTFTFAQCSPATFGLHISAHFGMESGPVRKEHPFFPLTGH